MIYVESVPEGSLRNCEIVAEVCLREIGPGIGNLASVRPYVEGKAIAS